MNCPKTFFWKVCLVIILAAEVIPWDIFGVKDGVIFAKGDKTRWCIFSWGLRLLHPQKLFGVIGGVMIALIGSWKTKRDVWSRKFEWYSSSNTTLCPQLGTSCSENEYPSVIWVTFWTIFCHPNLFAGVRGNWGFWAWGQKVLCWETSCASSVPY